MKPSSKNTRLLLLAFLALLLVFGGLLLRSFLNTTPPPQPPVPKPAAEPPRALREVILYFGAADGTYLVAESRELQDCLDEQACLRATLQALLDGPVSEAAPLFPPHTLLRDIRVNDQGQATVDFSDTLVSGHPGGSMSELLTVYSVVDTLAVDFPYIRQVSFETDGKPLETLKGHVDLRQPLTPDFSLTRPPAATEAPPTTSAAPAPAPASKDKE